jgi:hypothetical protein
MSAFAGGFRYLLLDDYNWSAFRNGYQPQCLNQDCFVTYGFGEPLITSYNLSRTASSQYHIVILCTSLFGANYLPAMAISDSANVPLLEGRVWDEQFDQPVGCSQSTWPILYPIMEQQGIFMYNLGVSPYWSWLRTDDSPIAWYARDISGALWYTSLKNATDFATLTWTARNGPNCLVQFRLRV